MPCAQGVQIMLQQCLILLFQRDPMAVPTLGQPLMALLGPKGQWDFLLWAGASVRGRQPFRCCGLHDSLSLHVVWVPSVIDFMWHCAVGEDVAVAKAVAGFVTSSG